MHLLTGVFISSRITCTVQRTTSLIFCLSLVVHNDFITQSCWRGDGMGIFMVTLGYISWSSVRGPLYFVVRSKIHFYFSGALKLFASPSCSLNSSWLFMFKIGCWLNMWYRLNLQPFYSFFNERGNTVNKESAYFKNFEILHLEISKLSPQEISTANSRKIDLSTLTTLFLVTD